MVYADTLLNDEDCTVPFTGQNDAFDKQLCAVISHNNKPISFFSIIIINMKFKYTATKK